jgi:vancomycin aglycone glucosyltransferase
MLTTVGSRGDVQPILALAVRLQELGQEVRVCAPPDFDELIQAHGIPFTPIGPRLAWTAKNTGQPTPDQRRQMFSDSFAAQFGAVTEAAQGCDVIVHGGYLVVAAPTVAEQMGIPYVFAGYAPVALPSSYHAPPLYPMLGEKTPDGTVDNATLWARDAERWNTTWGPLLNSYRAKAGLDPVENVRDHLFTSQPWLASDPTLAPWPGDSDVIQTGAWILPDNRPLSAELAEFLDAGDPPVYFGFGSIRAPEDLARTMIQAARAVGRRAIMLRGWADLSLLDNEPDCLSIGEVNQQALFTRVAATVHHGGAGTTTAAARAGAPQVVIPQHVDQPYFAQRVQNLGIGYAHAIGAPTAESLTEALSRALKPDVATQAKSIAAKVRTNGTDIATTRITDIAANRTRTYP